MSEEKQKDDGPPNQNQSGTSRWEWLIAGVGFALLVGTIGFTFYRAFRGDQSPPDILVGVEAIEAQRGGGGFLVRVRVTNRGGETASSLVVEGELKNGAESVETSEASFDYVPGHSERRGGLFFRNDPRNFAFEVRPLGYVEP